MEKLTHSKEKESRIFHDKHLKFYYKNKTFSTLKWNYQMDRCIQKDEIMNYLQVL